MGTSVSPWIKADAVVGLQPVFHAPPTAGSCTNCAQKAEGYSGIYLVGWCRLTLSDPHLKAP